MLWAVFASLLAPQVDNTNDCFGPETLQAHTHTSDKCHSSDQQFEKKVLDTYEIVQLYFYICESLNAEK